MHLKPNPHSPDCSVISIHPDKKRQDGSPDFDGYRDKSKGESRKKIKVKR